MAAAGESVDVGSLASLMVSVNVTSLGDEQLSGLVIDVEQLLNTVHALSAAALEEFQRRGLWGAEGALSAPGWAAARTGSPLRALRARVRAGAGLRLLPCVAAPARAGRLSPQHLEALASCARRHPELAARDEGLLLQQAERLDADAFGLLARQWTECAAAVEGPDPGGAPASEPIDELHVSQTFDGRYQLNGNFSADTGQLLHAALDAHVDRQLRATRNGDPSVTPVASRVRAAALVDLLTQCMRREPSEASAPDRYRVAVVVRADEAETRPLAVCDSPAFRVVLGAASEILDVGRLTSAWPAGIRRAIMHRDGGCVFPGCDRPPSWCDIHHCRPWSDGGRTSVDNGALLCRRHHTFVHQRGWRLGIEHGRPITRRPDGSKLIITRWPDLRAS